VERQGLVHIEFPGPVPREQMAAMFRGVHVGLSALPKHPYWRHALLNKIFSYMESGSPVVFAGEGDIVDLLNT